MDYPVNNLYIKIEQRELRAAATASVRSAASRNFAADFFGPSGR